MKMQITISRALLIIKEIDNVSCKHRPLPVVMTARYHKAPEGRHNVPQGWLVDSKRPGKQFFSHVGTEPPLPGYYQYFWGVNVTCSRTQHGYTRVGLEPPTSGSGVRGINHQATALL